MEKIANVSTLKRCLIVKLGQIGDVIMAIPAAHALHLCASQIKRMHAQSDSKIGFSRVRPVPQCSIEGHILSLGDRFSRQKWVIFREDRMSQSISRPGEPESVHASC